MEFSERAEKGETMKTALEIVEAALVIERQLRDQSFNEREICGVSELILRANMTVLALAPMQPLLKDPGVL